MKLTSVLNGAKFGQLYKLSGIVTYRLSPYEQKAFPQFVKHMIPNTIRRIRSNLFYVCPPFIVGYIIYDTCERRHAELQRKDPAEFADDE